MIAEKLKKSILQAAIQGKLTEQLPEDGDARDLLKEIQKEKARLIKEGKIKKEKPFPEISEEEIPFDIPDNWCWVRLGDLANYKKGPFGSALTKSMFIADGENAIKVYEQKNAIQKDAMLGTYFIKDQYYHKAMEGFTVVGGDIIISCAGTIGEAYVLPHDARIGIINQALMRVRVFDDLNELFFLEIFEYAINTKEAKGKGSAIKNIPPFEILKNIIIPLPPKSEQPRIVAKLIEIRTKIDILKNDENKLDALQKSFPKKMKDSILQYAIQGKLTDQIPEDGNANDLVRDIQKEKLRLIKEGKIKKEKPLPDISEDEIPFDIPDNWCWVRLGDLVCKNIKRGKSPVYVPSSGTLVFAQKCNTKAGYIDMELAKFLDESKLAKYPEEEFLIDEDIVINSTGNGTLGRVGIYRETDNLRKIPIVPDSHVTVIRVNRFMNVKYVLYCLKYYQPYMEKLGSGSTNQTELNANTIRALYFPVPPLAEQNRIVERLEEFLPLCESLE